MRGVVVRRDRRAGPGSSGMMGSPTFLSLPRDRLGRPVTLEYVADGPTSCRGRGSSRTADGPRRRAKSARRASFWHAQSVRCTCPNHQLRPGKGLYARIGGQLDSRFGWCIFGLRQRGAKVAVSACTPSRWARGPAQQREPSILPHSCRKKQRSARPSRQTALTSLPRRAALSAAP